MSNTIFLHVGTMKTGTTTIQNYLYENGCLLEKYNVYYPQFAMVQNNSRVVTANGQPFIDKLFTDNNDSLWAENLKRIESALKKGDLIISHEGFWHRGNDFVKLLVERYHFNVKIIVYLRRQDLFLESLYNQHIKDSFRTESIDDYVLSLMSRDYPRLDYYNNLIEFEKIVGANNIIVKTFEKQALANSTVGFIGDFMRTVIPSWKEDIQEDLYRTNEKISNNLVRIKHYFNTLSNGDFDGARHEAMIFFIILERLNIIKDVGFGYLMNEENFNRILSEYDVSNKMVAERYLGQDRLFFEEPKYVKYSQEPMSKDETDFVKILIQLMNWKEKRRQKDEEIKNRILSLARGRKIVLFGAGKNGRVFYDNRIVDIDKIVDNDSSKWGGGYVENHVVEAPKSVDDWTGYFVIVTPNQSDDIERDLADRGLERGKDYELLSRIMINN